MLKKYASLITAALLLNTFVFAQSASADTKPDKQARFAEKVKEGIFKLGVGKQSLVEVKLRDKTKLAGYVGEAADESFVVNNVKTGEATTVAYTSVTQVRGHNLSTGAKIAIGIAIGVGVALIILAIYINCCTG
jgi:hypothetical protein